MGQSGRVYSDAVTLNTGAGFVTLYSVDADPNGLLDANAGDFAYQVGTANRWSCTGGSVWICVGNASSSGNASGSVIWRPGGVEDIALGVYTSWATAHAAARVLADATERETWVLIDNSVAPLVPVTVPTGTYNMRNLRLMNNWARPDIESIVYVNTSVGCVFTDFNLGFAYIALTHLDPAVYLYAVAVDIVNGLRTWFQMGPNAYASGLVWNINNVDPAGGYLTFDVLSNSTLVNGSTVLHTGDNNDVILNLGPGGILEDDTIEGGVGTGLIVNVLGHYSERAQTAYTGSLTVTNQLVTSLAQVAPGSGVAVTAGSHINNRSRTVFGTISLAATAGNGASIAIAIETGIGTGFFTTVQNFVQAATDTASRTYAYCFLVPAGRQYRFVKGGLGGVTENISLYSFIDDKL